MLNYWLYLVVGLMEILRWFGVEIICDILEVLLTIFVFEDMLVVRGRFCQNFRSNNMGNTCTYFSTSLASQSSWSLISAGQSSPFESSFGAELGLAQVGIRAKARGRG